jgi:hypothetical protein
VLRNLRCLSNPELLDGRVFDIERGEKSNIFVNPITDLEAKAVDKLLKNGERSKAGHKWFINERLVDEQEEVPRLCPVSRKNPEGKKGKSARVRSPRLRSGQAG